VGWLQRIAYSEEVLSRKDKIRGLLDSKHLNVTIVVDRKAWNFHERLDRQAGVISNFLATVDKKAQARFERALDQLRQMPRQAWSKPAPASHLGNHTYVIRFTDTSRQQLRVFGHFYDPHDCFAMTSHGCERDNVYDPENYQAISIGHKSTCDQDFARRTAAFRTCCALCQPKGSQAN
jgi:hypothetical protein